MHDPYVQLFALLLLCAVIARIGMELRDRYKRSKHSTKRRSKHTK